MIVVAAAFTLSFRQSGFLKGRERDA